MSNPLLDAANEPAGLADFAAIRAEHVEAAIDQLLAENRSGIEKLLERGGPFTWDNLVTPLEEMEDRLNRAWSPVNHLNSVVNEESLRKAYNACLPKLADYTAELGQNRALYDAFDEVRANADSLGLDAAQVKILDDELRDFRLAGVALDDAPKARYRDIQQALSAKQAKFEENLIDSAAAWHLKIDDESRLSGIPQDAIDRAASTAADQGGSGWWFSLDFPSFHAVITHADDRDMRREMYTAWVTRASDQGPTAGRFDNSELMQDILGLRAEEAELLGFRNFAEVSLESKMAKSPDEVLDFLAALVKRIRPVAQAEFDELQGFAATELDMGKLEAWDIGFAAEKLRKARFDISQEELRPYFPLPKVMDGLFRIVGELYDLEVKEEKPPSAWHADVRYFAVRDSGGTLRGHLFMDLFARPQKRSGAWMDEARNRFRREAGVQTPIAHLCCNFAPPGREKPSLLSHDDVQTLFHEFGHCLHHLLTQVDYPAAAGINGVAWDAVELPSQFHENFTWDRAALDLISGHVDTGAPLPDELHDKMLASRTFHAGLFLVRQLEFATFDMRLHTGDGKDVMGTLAEVRDEVAVVPAPSFNRFPHSFSHIFAGGYAAGYYSYLWAEVMSADAFGAFEEAGLFDRATGQRFLASILERGGSADPESLFVEFRGRKPTQEAFLRQHGLENAA